MAKTITGTLHYLDSGQLVLDWGAGNFLALKFTNNKPEEVKTIKVGLDPSQGSGLVPLDEDMNGVFKITDKDTQKFIIESYDAEDVLVERAEYDLSGLVCERPPIHIHFIDHSTQQQISSVEMSGVGSTYDFEVETENIPEGATLTVSSDDTDIITVSEDEYYTITGVAEGSANILATVTEDGQTLETVELPVDVLAIQQTILIKMEQTTEDPSIVYPIFAKAKDTVLAKFTALEIDGQTPVTTLTANDITLSVDGSPVSNFTFNYDSTFEDYTISFTHSGTPDELVITVNYQSHDNEFTEEITAVDPDGSTITPTDDAQILVRCANIYDKTSITTIAQLIADTTTLAAVMNSSNAVDYLVRSTTFASAITADQTAMTDIGANNYAADTLLADSTWSTAICNSTYFESVLSTKVPQMTSDTAPSGVVTASSTYSGTWKSYGAFNDNYEWYATNNNSQYVQYKFPAAMLLKKFKYKPSTNAGYATAGYTITLQASNDGSTWTQLATQSGIKSEYNKLLPDNNTEYSYYRMNIYCENPGQYSICPNASVIQYYGRKDV